jgi:hypothetical protein
MQVTATVGTLATENTLHHLWAYRKVDDQELDKMLCFEDRGETLADIARSYNLNRSTISRLT